MKKFLLEAVMLTIVAGAMYYLSTNIEPPWDRTLVLSAVLIGIHKILVACCCMRDKWSMSTGRKWHSMLKKRWSFKRMNNKGFYRNESWPTSGL